MIRAILTDIEGTTSSLSFVHEVLFPYARERIASFVQAHAAMPEVASQLDEVRRLAGAELSDAQVAEQLIRWIDKDKKITPLKALQGMLWEEGYHRGDFQGHVYDDAAQRLRAWYAQGIRLYVYSSGSVQAQRLLFAHTAFGDLTPLFSDYFDTRIGGKREAESYARIAVAIDQPPAAVLFLSDIREELDAAQIAGMRTCALMRGAEVGFGAHPVARDFRDIKV